MENEWAKQWEDYSKKLEETVQINRSLLKDVTRMKGNRRLQRINRNRIFGVVIGIPYALLCAAVSTVAWTAEAYIIGVAFGLLGTITIGLCLAYIYQLMLLLRLPYDEDVMRVQRSIDRLITSNIATTRLAILQLPIWAFAFMSTDAFLQSPWLYGGVHLCVFVGLSFLTMKIYRATDINGPDGFWHRIFYRDKEHEMLKAFRAGLAEWGIDG